MGLNPGGSASYSWNYSNSQNPGFSLEFVGTVVAVQEKQHMDWNNNGGPRTPAFWSNGDPKMDIRIAFADPEGNLKTFQFPEASKKQAANPNNTHVIFSNLAGGVMNLIGKTVHIMTWPANPETGAPWGIGNPRIFSAGLVPDVTYELAQPLPDEFKVPKLLADTAVSGGQPVPPMVGQYYGTPTFQPRQQPQYQQQVQPQYQQPMPYQQMPQQVPQMQPQYQQPTPYQQMPQQAPQMQPQYQQPTIQQLPPQQAPMTAQMPSGMDPMVAAAMQAVGAQNVQPVYPDIPF